MVELVEVDEVVDVVDVDVDVLVEIDEVVVVEVVATSVVVALVVVVEATAAAGVVTAPAAAAFGCGSELLHADPATIATTTDSRARNVEGWRRWRTGDKSLTVSVTQGASPALTNSQAALDM